MSLWGRIGAGIGAGAAAVGGTLAALPKEDYSRQIENQDVPVMVQEAPESARPRSMEDIVNQYDGGECTITAPQESPETGSDRTQNLRALGENMEDMASGGAEAAKAKNKREETGENINASRAPLYGDSPPPDEAKEHEPEAAPGYEYDYGIGM
jgi:hypothetical protein